MKRNSVDFFVAKGERLFCLLILSLSVVACSTTQSTDRTFVLSQLEESRLGGGNRYALVFNNEEAQNSLSKNRNAITSLHLALESRGYVESAIPQDADLYIVIDCGYAGERLAYREKALSPDQLNPDSIRYKNVAGMVGKGRYAGLLNDDPYSSSRENLPTYDDAGNPLKQRHIDELSAHREGRRLNTRLEATVKYTSYLSIGAWRPVKSEDKLDIEQLWEVRIMNDQFDDDLTGRLERMVDISGRFIETKITGWQEVVAKK